MPPAYPAYEFDKQALHDLFVLGTAQLSRLGKLSEAIATGIDETLLLRLCSVVTAKVARLSGLRLDGSAASGPGQMWDTREAIRRLKKCLQQGQPVIVALERTLDHWTVVIGYRAKRLYLFDCSRCRWVLIKSITASSRPSKERYRITQASTIALKTA